MKKYWIKLWLEILNDPKMGQLPDWLWRRAIELFLLAGENGDDGLLQPVTDLAWRLRSSEEKMTESLAALSEVGVVHETPDGWIVTNFKKRQIPLDASERGKLFRQYHKGEAAGDVPNKRTEREHNQNETFVAPNGDSASASASVSVSEEGGTGGETENVFKVYEHNIGVLTPLISDALKDAETIYDPVWICAAIQEAVKSNARSWKYCEAILKRWKKEGFKAPKNGRKSPYEILSKQLEEEGHGSSL